MSTGRSAKSTSKSTLLTHLHSVAGATLNVLVQLPPSVSMLRCTFCSTHHDQVTKLSENVIYALLILPSEQLLVETKQFVRTVRCHSPRYAQPYHFAFYVLKLSCARYSARLKDLTMDLNILQFYNVTFPTSTDHEATRPAATSTMTLSLGF